MTIEHTEPDKFFKRPPSKATIGHRYKLFEPCPEDDQVPLPQRTSH